MELQKRVSSTSLTATSATKRLKTLCFSTVSTYLVPLSTESFFVVIWTPGECS